MTNSLYGPAHDILGNYPICMCSHQGDKRPNLGSVHFLPYFLYANSEGSGEIGCMHMLISQAQ